MGQNHLRVNLSRQCTTRGGPGISKQGGVSPLTDSYGPTHHQLPSTGAGTRSCRKLQKHKQASHEKQVEKKGARWEERQKTVHE